MDPPSLQQLVDQFFEPEEVEWRCERCDAQQAGMTHRLATLPRVLILHLKRFGYRVRGQRRLALFFTHPPPLSIADP